MIEQTLQLGIGRVQFWLLALPPSGPVQLTVRRQVQVDTSLNGQEVRRPLGSTLRFSQNYETSASGALTNRLVRWAREHGAELVAVPLWAAVCAPSEDRSIYQAAAWVAVSAGYERAEVFAGTPPSWLTPDDAVAPLVFGRLANLSVDHSDTVAAFGVEHVENSPAGLAVRITPATEQAGPMGPGGAPAFSLCPYLIDSRTLDESVRDDVAREDIGFGRQSEEYRDQDQVTELKLSAVAQSRIELARLLSFFCERSSAVPFWISSPIEGGSNAKPGDWLAYTTPGRPLEFGQVRSVTNGVPVVLPVREQTSDTFVSKLVLTRFRTDRMTVQQVDPTYATTTLSLVEVPQLEDHGGRTFAGEASGAVRPRAWLYEIRSGVWVERMTSHDVALHAEGRRWDPATVTHGELGSSVTGLRDSVKIQLGLSVSSLAKQALGRQLSGKMSVRIVEVNLGSSGVADGQTVFTGEMESISLSGVSVSLTCRPWPVVASMRIPNFRIQPGCNHAVFGIGCGLDRNAWDFDATVSAPGAQGYPFTFGLSGLTGPVSVTAANYFAGGWVELGRDKVSIRSSTAPVAGELSVTLARDPREFPSSGASIKLLPGCDGRWETCQSKFSNQLNFGGHPHVPTANPSLVKLSASIAGGKK